MHSDATRLFFDQGFTWAHLGWLVVIALIAGFLTGGGPHARP